VANSFQNQNDNMAAFRGRTAGFQVRFIMRIKDRTQPLCYHDFVSNLDKDSAICEYRNLSKKRCVLLSQHVLHVVSHSDVQLSCIQSVCCYWIYSLYG
jgi:hypothetical protein